MSLHAVTSDSLTQQLGREVPDVFVLVAKHRVLGMDEVGIREVLNCDASELSEILNDPLYREVRTIIGALHAQAEVNQAEGLDALEEKAINTLLKNMQSPNVDPEFALRVGAFANKAQRRQKAGKDEGVLQGGKQVKRLTLTSRLVSRYAGGREDVEERTLSIEDGSMEQPKFQEVNQLLSIQAQPALPKTVEVSTQTAEVSFDELDEEMRKRENHGD